MFGRKHVDTSKNTDEKSPSASTAVSTISEAAEKIGELSGFKDEYLGGRKARIFVQAKNSMQSGTFQQRKWRVEFDNRTRWENPNMGWASSGDMFSNSHIEFGDKEDAIMYCERMGNSLSILNIEKHSYSHHAQMGLTFLSDSLKLFFQDKN